MKDSATVEYGYGWIVRTWVKMEMENKAKKVKKKASATAHAPGPAGGGRGVPDGQLLLLLWVVWLRLVSVHWCASVLPSLVCHAPSRPSDAARADKKTDKCSAKTAAACSAVWDGDRHES